VGELKVIDNLGRYILVFITLTGPFDKFHGNTYTIFLLEARNEAIAFCNNAKIYLEPK
jgi:hypothetical protein